MDSALKQILKEEKRRKAEKAEKEERKEKSERKERLERRERAERKERSERRERSERKVVDEEIQKIEEPKVLEKIEDDGIDRFMFIYEDKDGNLFSTLDNLKKEGEIIKIFPVYVTGNNENLTAEEVTYSGDQFIPLENNKESTWLSVITSSDEKISILPFDIEDIVVYNGKFFHCDKDLFEYLESNGLEYLSVSK